MTQNYLDKLPAERSEAAITDYKPLYTDLQAIAEANRCLYCHDAPCIEACPTDINIPEFIHRIASGNIKGSARTILDSNILGLSCASVCPVEVLCVGSCVYNHMQIKPIEIGRLQRYATEFAYQKGIQYYKKGPDTGKKVALIGAGPASLACAAQLAIMGHNPVIFERHALPGGLNTTGVAPYKMRADNSLREVAYIQEIGVEIRTGMAIGKEVTFAELEAQYDAIFIGAGLGPDSFLDVPGEDLPGVFGALEVIEALKLTSFPAKDYQHAVVVGGGNTALDVVRELRKLGVPNVTMVYRRSDAEMSGYAHEMAAALQEGVQFKFQALPVQYLGNEKVTGVRCVQMELSEPDASGRRSPMPVAGSEFEIKADLVAMATGQGKLTALFGQISDLELNRGRVIVNAQGQTTNPKYFAGGDCVNGGKEVVNAAAEGKHAAFGIDAYLKEGN
jgi:dihydropyrimidine dehydrogenase (NAD+) subunit PreT